jgi:hypothetical protein
MKRVVKATALAIAVVLATATAALACTITSVTASSACTSGQSVVTAVAHGVGNGDSVAFSNNVTGDTQHSTDTTWTFVVPNGTASVTVSAYATLGENRSENTATVTLAPTACVRMPVASLSYVRCSDPRYEVTLDNSKSNTPVTFTVRYRRTLDLGVKVKTYSVAGAWGKKFETPPLHKGSSISVRALGHRLAFVSVVAKDTCN